MEIDATTMNTVKKTKKPEPDQTNRKFKLPAGVVLLAVPNDSQNDFKCVRCKWEWPARKKNGLPARCPHCSSPSWNKNRVMANTVLGGTRCHCRHCNHKWTATKTEGYPAMCPRCRRYDWNNEAALPSAKPPGVK